MSSFSSFHPHPGIFKKLPPSDAFLVVVFLILITAQISISLTGINERLTVETPIRKGELHEGIVGVPVHSNPLFATSTVEYDVSALLHAGLLRYDSMGTLTEHLAKSWEKTGSQYVFQIRENAFFHDGVPLTAHDVVHTIEMVGLLEENNPYRAVWRDVEVSAPDKETVVVSVPSTNHHFPEGFTMPILPKHIWQKIPPHQWKRHRGSGVYVGAGPYQHDSETTTLEGRLTTMVLSEFPGYVLGRPYLESITLHFFTDAPTLLEMYRQQRIGALHSIAPTEAAALLRHGDDTGTLHSARTNRVFGVFFNTREEHILNDAFLRSILAQTVDRDAIVQDVFHGHADVLSFPIATDLAVQSLETDLAELQQTLEDIGWKFEGSSGQREKDGVALEIVLVLPDIEETRRIADLLAAGWRTIGVRVETRALPPEVLASVVQEQQFDALLHGYEATVPKDLIRLWKPESSGNGALITGFESETLSALLDDLSGETPRELPEEEDIRIPDDKWHEMVYTAIKVEMMKSVPAIFLYSPHFLYILPKGIFGAGTRDTTPGRVHKPSDRFHNVHEWYTQKEKVWNFIQT